MSKVYILRATGRRMYFESSVGSRLDGTAYRTEEAAEAALPGFMAWCCGEATLTRDHPDRLFAMDPETIKVDVVPLDLEDAPDRGPMRKYEVSLGDEPPRAVLATTPHNAAEAFALDLCADGRRWEVDGSQVTVVGPQRTLIFAIDVVTSIRARLVGSPPVALAALPPTGGGSADGAGAVNAARSRRIPPQKTRG